MNIIATSACAIGLLIATGCLSSKALNERTARPLIKAQYANVPPGENGDILTDDQNQPY